MKYNKKKVGNFMKHRVTQVISILFIIGIIALVLMKWSTTLFYILGISFQLLSIVISFRLFFIDKRGTNSKVAWILIVFVLPIMGIIFYFLFGRNPQTRKFSEAQIVESEKIIDTIHGIDKSNLMEAPKLALKQAKLTEIAPLNGNKVDILTNGDITFDEILINLKKATDHIHLQYYIFKSDEISTQIRDILIEKAKSGIEVRFMYDGLGSYGLSYEFLAPLRNAGAEVYAYDPIYSPWIARTANLRNHRKIIVIDGQVGFTGGLNVGEEYRSNTDQFKVWRDTHIRIEGLAVRELQEAFLKDWVYLKNENNSANHFISDLGLEKYFNPKPCGNDWAQVIYGGPYDLEKQVRDSMLNLIENAEESVWIVSPYFIPDDESLAVIRRVAMNGIDVKVIIPGKGDRGISFHGSNAFIETMIDAGAEMYAYDKDSFVHAKIIIVDGKKAAVGTANFDVRSFRLNHELMVFLYEDSLAVKHLVKDFKQDLIDSRVYTKEHMLKKSLIQKLKENLSSLLSPIL